VFGSCPEIDIARALTGATRVDFLAVQSGARVRLQCLGCEHGTSFLMLRALAI
jgi:hypothetical protein